MSTSTTEVLTTDRAESVVQSPLVKNDCTATQKNNLTRFLVATLALMTLNFALCEFVARFVVYLGKPASSQNPQYDLKARVADTVYAGDDNIVLCGDSLMKQGIYPELLSTKLHKINEHIRVVNLATNAGSQKDAIYYLDYIQKKGIKPRLVIFDYEVAMMGYPTYEGNMEWGQAKSYLFNGVLTRPTDFKKSCQIFLSDCSYIVRQRGNLKHFLLDFLAVLPFPNQFNTKTFNELSDVNDHETSWAGMSPDHKLTEAKDWPQQQWRIHSSFTHSPLGGHFDYNPDMYSIIIKYCQEHKLPLALVWLPHESSIYGAFWYKAPWTPEFFRKKFENYAQEPYVTPVFINTLPEDCAYFSDYRHLSTYGCIKATELMADAIMSKQVFKNILFDFRKVPEKSTK